MTADQAIAGLVEAHRADVLNLRMEIHRLRDERDAARAALRNAIERRVAVLMVRGRL